MDLLKPIALLLLSYGIVVWGGSTFVRIILRRLRETKPGNKTEPGSLQVSEEINEKREMKGVGRYTGYLERFLVFNAYYFKQKTDIVLLLLVVFLLMAKLIILWNYQKSGGEKMSERYLLGTLSSFIFALVCAFLLFLILSPPMHGH